MRSAAFRVGALALAGIVLLGLAIAAVGGQWFSARDRAVMRFERSVYGLNVGAPVVLRGVRVGQVTAVGLAPAGPGGLAMPVTAEFDRAMLRDLLGADAPGSGPALPVLIARGLVARLATQSLLTGLLYVDLDLVPGRAPAPAVAGPLPAIPTEATRLQTLQSQLERLDLAQIGEDLAAVAGSARLLLAGPEAQQLLQRSAAAAGQLQQLAATLQQQLPPLARSAETTLAETRRGMAALAQTGAQVGTAAQQVGAAASQAQASAQALAQAGTPALAEVQRAALALGQAAGTLREAAADDSALRLNADRALQDVARAARALRELGELLERQPDALLRGRATAP
ncbi:MAG: MlaD family protein [Pseudomonadota bacterium]